MYSLFSQISALQVLGGITFFVRTKIIAVVLGPAGVGLVSVVDQFVQMMLQLSAFAIPFAAIKILSQAHSESAEKFGATYATLLRLLLILGSVGAALGISMIWWRPDWVSTSFAAHIPLVVIGLLALPAMILHGFFRNVPAAAMLPITSAVWDVVTGAILGGLAILGILLFGVPGYFVGGLIGCVLLSASYYLYFLHRFDLSMTGQPTNSIRKLLKDNPAFVELSLTSYAVAFVTPFALFIVRATVLESLGIATAGLLQAAIGISLAINLVLNPLNGLLLTPLVNRKMDKSRKHREAEEFQRKLLLPLAVVVLLPTLFPDLVIVGLYSFQFVEAAHVLYWFVLGQAIMQIAGVYNALMIGLDQMKACAIIVVVCTAANAALAILLVPPLGLLGAGIAAFTSSCLLALGTFLYLYAREGFEIGRAVGLGTLLLFAGLALAGAFLGTRPSLEVPNLLAKVLVCAAVLGFVLPLSLDRQERHAILVRLGAAFGRG
jgi:enterobacterial common antigen flippase